MQHTCKQLTEILKEGLYTQHLRLLQIFKLRIAVDSSVFFFRDRWFLLNTIFLPGHLLCALIYYNEGLQSLHQPHSTGVVVYCGLGETTACI